MYVKKKQNETKENILQEMMDLATKPANDAVCLAYLPQEDWGSSGKLGLVGITEFKRNANGTVELKLTDRMTVLEKLLDRLEGDGQDKAAAFFKVLEAPPTRPESGQQSRRCYSKQSPPSSAWCSSCGTRVLPMRTRMPFSAMARCEAAKPY